MLCNRIRVCRFFLSEYFSINPNHQYVLISHLPQFHAENLMWSSVAFVQTIFKTFRHSLQVYLICRMIWLGVWVMQRRYRDGRIFITFRRMLQSTLGVHSCTSWQSLARFCWQRSRRNRLIFGIVPFYRLKLSSVSAQHSSQKDLWCGSTMANS